MAMTASSPPPPHANTSWITSPVSWGLVLIGWWMSPTINFFLNKLFSYLDFDTSRNLRNLERGTIPNLKQTLKDGQDQRMMGEAEGKMSLSDLIVLDKIMEDLKSALHDAEDILDLVDYHLVKKKVIGHGSAGACISRIEGCIASWFQRLGAAAYAHVAHWNTICRAALLRCKSSLDRLHFLSVRGGSVGAVSSVKEVSIAIDAESVSSADGVCTSDGVSAAILNAGEVSSAESVSGEDGISTTTSSTQSVSVVHKLRFCWSSDLVPWIIYCYRWILTCLTNAVANVLYYRDWSNEAFGVGNSQEDGMALDSFLHTVSRMWLTKRIQQIDDILNDSRKSHLLDQQSNSSENSERDIRTAHKEHNDYTTHYRQLDADIRRCIAYLSTFPRSYKLERVQLIRLWVAQGFIKTSRALLSKKTSSEENDMEMEDIGQEYFDKLLELFSFLKPQPTSMDCAYSPEYFTIDGQLHRLAEEVAGGDFFRVVSDGTPIDIPRGVRHLFIGTKNGAAQITEKNLDLMRDLRTLIIEEHNTGTDRMQTIEVMKRHDLERALERLFRRLRKLRVLIVELDRDIELLLPASIDQMKHLRYIGFHCPGDNAKLILPSTISKLYHMQTIDVPSNISVSYPEGMTDLILLRHITGWPVFPNVGRLGSLQTMEYFCVNKRQQGYELRQLMDLNKLRGTLIIDGLADVESKEEALEAHLSSKKRLTKLTLQFSSCNLTKEPAMEAEVLEGLCPPKDLQELTIKQYNGSRFPSWILNDHDPDAPKHPCKLRFYGCSPLATFR